MRVLIDASAAVKILLREDGRQEAVALWESSEGVLASRLTYTEVRAALAAALRARRIPLQAYRTAKAEFDYRWEEVRVIELTEEVSRAAGDVAELLGLRSADAIQLASALSVAASDLTFATWDRELARAATEAGLRVVPAL